MENQVLKFLVDNETNIIFLLIGGFISFIIAFFFYIISDDEKISAQRERKKIAKNSLLDILEENIINKNNISLEKYNNLRNAIERQHSVDLSYEVTLTILLQDLLLKFEKNLHIDYNQKEEYCRQIQNQIQENRAKEEPQEYMRDKRDSEKSIAILAYLFIMSLFIYFERIGFFLIINLVILCLLLIKKVGRDIYNIEKT